MGIVRIVDKVGIVTTVGIVRRKDPQLLSDKTTFVVDNVVLEASYLEQT